jgi:hypothetical protein
LIPKIVIYIVAADGPTGGPPDTISITYTGAYYDAITSLLQKTSSTTPSDHSKTWVTTGTPDTSKEPYLASTPADSGDGTPGNFSPLQTIIYKGYSYTKSGAPSAFRTTESRDRTFYSVVVALEISEGVPPAGFKWEDKARKKTVVQSVSWASDVSYAKGDKVTDADTLAAEAQKKKTELNNKLLDLTVNTPCINALLQITKPAP